MGSREVSPWEAGQSGEKGILSARDQNRVLEESQIPARGFSCPERIISSVFISLLTDLQSLC